MLSKPNQLSPPTPCSTQIGLLAPLGADVAGALQERRRLGRRQLGGEDVDLGVREVPDAAGVVEIEVGGDDVPDVRGIVTECLDLADRRLAAHRRSA